MKKINAPSHLSPDARKRWHALRSEYGIDDVGGLELLRVYAEAYDRHRSAREQIDEEGQTVADRFGQAKPHALLAVERDSRAAMIAALKALSLDVEPLNAKPGRPAGS